jgi:Lrp/AsnC family transcriptional regulator
MVKIDDTDRHLLRLLQDDATRSLESLAAAVSISTNSAWRRVKRLEEEGVIRKRVAVLDADLLGFPVTVFVAVRTNDHSIEWLNLFREAAIQIAEIVEVHRMAGDVDYLLKVHVGSVADYDRVYKSLLQRINLTDVNASFAMETIKNEGKLPL